MRYAIPIVVLALVLAGCARKADEIQIEQVQPPPQTEQPAAQPAAPAQPAAAQLYACPMHPEFTTTDPAAKCPTCGAEVKPVEPKAVVTYACPMHPDQKSDTPAKCPTCGMDMKEVPAAPAAPATPPAPAEQPAGTGTK